MEEKKTYLIEKLIAKLTEEKNLVNQSLIKKDYDDSVKFQKFAFLTAKALRKIVK